MRYCKYYFILELVWIILTCSCYLLGYASPIGGGNAMQLHQMTAEIMNKNRHCQGQMGVCQSVCMQQNQTTGCFECAANCGTGVGSPNINLGGINSGMNMMGFFNPGNGYFYCQPSCKPTYNSLGGIECQCRDQTAGEASLTTFIPEIWRSTASPIPTSQQTSHRTALVTKKVLLHLPTTTSQKQVPSRKSIESSTQSSIASILFSSSKSSFTRPSTLNIKTPPSHPARASTSRIEYENMKRADDSSKEKTNVIIIFVLTTALIVSLTICIVFLVAWRRTTTQLKRNQNELYFVHKAIRQDSLASRPSNAPEAVYAHITQRPEPPPRTPPISPLTPTAPSSQFLLRTVSLSSETSLKETDGESELRHDYLQLI